MEFGIYGLITNEDPGLIALRSREFGPAIAKVDAGYSDGTVRIGYFIKTESPFDDFISASAHMDFDAAKALADEIRATVARAKLAKLKEGE